MNQLQQGNKVRIKSTNQLGTIVDFVDGYTARISIVDFMYINKYTKKATIKAKVVEVLIKNLELVA